MAAGCAKNEIEKKITDKDKKDTIITLKKPEDVSASFESKEYTVQLSRDLTGIAKANIHDYNSDFIREVKIQGDKITFWLEQNNNIARGYRQGTIDITANDKVIQSFNVYQARNPEAPQPLQWATKEATASGGTVDMYALDHSAKEITQFIYNLEKYTNGKDSYKNYPAFAYCIEMNHDLSNMEWFLPSRSGMWDILASKQYDYFKNKEFWTSRSSGGEAFVVMCTSKGVSEGYFLKSEYKNVFAARSEEK